MNHPFITKFTVSENIDDNDDDESPEFEENKEEILTNLAI